MRRGGAVSGLTGDQSTHIRPEALHALENAGDIPLEVIEVLSGSCLGEADIVRVEGRYGRSLMAMRRCHSRCLSGPPPRPSTIPRRLADLVKFRAAKPLHSPAPTRIEAPEAAVAQW